MPSPATTTPAAAALVTPTPEPAPPPERDVYAPAINPNVTEESIEVISRKEAQQKLTEQLSQDALDPRYAVETRPIYRGVKTADFGKSQLSTAFSDEAMSMFVALKPELDDMAVRFGVPPLRGYKTTVGPIGSMGDGVLNLNPNYFSGYAGNIGAKAGARLEAMVSEMEGLRKQIQTIGDELRSINEKIAASVRGSDEFNSLWERKATLITEHNRIAPKINKLSKSISAAKRSSTPAVDWKPGDDVAKRPFGTHEYWETGLDKARNVLYHEFAHHIHQTYNKTNSRLRERPPIENELMTIWRRKTMAEKDRQPSKYGTTDPYEYFAENFSLYMMGKRDLVDPDAAKLIERLLDEQANR